MEQNIIQIGNSVGIIIPQAIQGNTTLKPGEKIFIERDPMSGKFILSKKRGKIINAAVQANDNLSPEFLSWVKKFTATYKEALTELANK